MASLEISLLRLKQFRNPGWMQGIVKQISAVLHGAKASYTPALAKQLQESLTEGPRFHNYTC